jgi:hypothetical protein
VSASRAAGLTLSAGPWHDAHTGRCAIGRSTPTRSPEVDCEAFHVARPSACVGLDERCGPGFGCVGGTTQPIAGAPRGHALLAADAPDDTNHVFRRLGRHLREARVIVTEDEVKRWFGHGGAEMGRALSDGPLHPTAPAKVDKLKRRRRSRRCIGLSP